MPSIFESTTKIQPRIGPRRFTYAGIPNLGAQKSLRYSVLSSKDGTDKEFQIHLGSKGGSILRWKIKANEDGKGAKAERMPTTPIAQAREEDEKDVETQGVMQIHKSNGDEIYGTMQDGKRNQSVRFVRNPDGSGWDMQPAKSPKARNESALDFITTMKSKTAAPLTGQPDISLPIQDQPDWNNQVAQLHHEKRVQDGNNLLTWPLTGDNLLGQTALTAGIGVVGGALSHGASKLRKLFTGEQDSPDDPSLGEDMIRYGILGGMVPSAWRLGNYALGGTRLSPGQAKNWINHSAQPNPHYQDAPYVNSKLLDDQGNAITEDLGFEKVSDYGTDNMDFRQVINAIRADTTISMMEREQLINQAHQASRKGMGVDPSALTEAGMGALAGYIMSKLMGMGRFGQAAMSGLGGMMGYSMGKSPSNIERSESGYSYN